MNILAISGSARRASTNTALLRNLARVAPQGVNIRIFDDVGSLPVFSPDLEGEATPSVVQAFIEQITSADGLILSSPEYVRALPGGLKNAIDWLVSGDAIIHKPIMLAHASHRGDDMLTSLRVVLATVSSGFREDIFLRVPLMNKTEAEVSITLAKPEQHEAALVFLANVAHAVQGAKANT